MVSIEAQAFLLVIGAGLSTAVGASVVFFPALANLGRPGVLSLALSFAAGTMLYVSLTDILEKSIGNFKAAGITDNQAVIYGNLSFFGGVVLMIVLDFIIDKVLAWDLKRAQQQQQGGGGSGTTNKNVVALVDKSIATIAPPDGDTLNKMREDFEHKVRDEHEAAAAAAAATATEHGDDDDDKNTTTVGVEQTKVANDEEEASGTGTGTDKGSSSIAANTNNNDDDDNDNDNDNDKYVLKHMSWAMAVAIGVHNFPEGMLTYLAYTQEPSVGVALAIGIAFHNIPEGLSVSMPLYYATGRRWHSFLWGTLSGLTEPLGALIVWAGLSGSNGSPSAHAVVFGLVGGMMTTISVTELMPAAFRYATNAKHAGFMTLFGMFFVASSIMLFKAA